ncbi:MAG: diacylglycerol kinase family lipid kinase [Thermodesulfovibrionales bacterium]
MKAPIVLIANPAAKRASEHKIKQAARLLRSAGREVAIYLTEKRGDAETIAKRAAGDNVPLIIAAGGDGTFNEVINGIAHTDTKLAILPMGTTNVLAKELSIPEDVEGALKVALSENVHTVSLGRIDFTPHLACPELAEGSLLTRYFCLMAGVGFDGEAVYGINESVKRYSGKGAYILSGLKTLLSYSPEVLTFAANGKTCTGYSAIIGKASKYGGNFRVTPDASLLNHEIYICIMHGKKRLDILRYVSGILMGTHLRFKDITYLKTTSVEIKGQAHIQIDGDYLGRTPATITVAPDALRLIF